MTRLNSARDSAKMGTPGNASVKGGKAAKSSSPKKAGGKKGKGGGGSKKKKDANDPMAGMKSKTSENADRQHSLFELLAKELVGRVTVTEPDEPTAEGEEVKESEKKEQE